MGQTSRLGAGHTAVYSKDGFIIVRYYQTDIVAFSEKKVILNSGGYLTASTKTRMNQASNQYNLGYQVYAKGGQWYVSTGAKNDLPFVNGIELHRRGTK